MGTPYFFKNCMYLIYPDWRKNIYSKGKVNTLQVQESSLQLRRKKKHIWKIAFSAWTNFYFAFLSANRTVFFHAPMTQFFCKTNPLSFSPNFNGAIYWWCQHTGILRVIANTRHLLTGKNINKFNPNNKR